MSATKREEVSSHLRYIRLELREIHQMLIKEDLLPDLDEAKEVHSQLDALLDLVSKELKKMNIEFNNFKSFNSSGFYFLRLSCIILIYCIFL